MSLDLILKHKDTGVQTTKTNFVSWHFTSAPQLSTQEAQHLA